MKLFKELLLVPATLGLMSVSPTLVHAQSYTSDLDKYTNSDQVTSITQFSDVQPTDWAYQALGNLVERYGCVAGYPNGTYLGGQSMTRYEAAALLNACMDRVTEVTDELRKLQNEFRDELIVINARVDGLEARVGTVESTQFSTTTKLNGEVNFILGGVPDYNNPFGEDEDGTTMNYDVRLNLDTSFTGRDLLRTRLRAGNFDSYPFGSSSSLFKLDKAENTDGNVEIDRLYYQFPVNNNFNVTVGALARNTEMAWRPSAYKSDVLDFFGLSGAPGVYNKATGPGAGVEYTKDRFIANVNFVAQDGADSEDGIFEESGALNVMTQLGYRQENWGVALGYRYGTEGTRPRTYNGFTGANGELLGNQTSNSVAVSGYWQPVEVRWAPSVSAGYGYNWVDGSTGLTDATNSDSWYVGLQWDDAFVTGNSAGMAIGEAPSSDNVDDALMAELFYRFQVTDNISITPAVFYVSNDQAQVNESNWGGIVQTKFKF